MRLKPAAFWSASKRLFLNQNPARWVKYKGLVWIFCVRCTGSNKNNLHQSDHAAEGARVRLEDWALACTGENKPMSSRKNFGRTLSSLKKFGLVEVHLPYVYLKPPHFPF
ncbi:hypothetical protein [Sansalvadorimonas verongulae]|uniref:hypothetical protein n=1 Tax=Sansalvadorimonas verongulae TaxID=2172824 RepID=UPI0012BD244C|nr:hypothetical protein [Sansalvadorimonas verongulae]MTI12953.1 hypothetical protein [Sansalvadorimonas verongulae]